MKGYALVIGPRKRVVAIDSTPAGAVLYGAIKLGINDFDDDDKIKEFCESKGAYLIEIDFTFSSEKRKLLEG